MVSTCSLCFHSLTLSILVQLIACGTCLDYFGLKERVAVGQVGGMAAILEAMLEAENVLSV